MSSSLHTGHVLSLFCEHLTLCALRAVSGKMGERSSAGICPVQQVMALLVLVQRCGPIVSLTCQTWLGFYAYFAF